MRRKTGPGRHSMSIELELKQYVGMLASDSETKSYEILQYAENLGHFLKSFNALANGTNDPSAKAVSVSFMTAQKELYSAAKATLKAVQSAYDWCGDAPKELVLKKVR